MKNKFLEKYGPLNVALFSILALTQVLSACQQKPLNTPTIVPARICSLFPGDSIPLAVTGVEGDGISYEWSTSGGTITPPTGSAVNFTAPDNAKQVIIKVTAKKDGMTSETTIVCNIEIVPTPTSTATATPIPTDTPVPTDTPTITPSPEPIDCRHISITEELFPRLADVSNQYPFYGPLDDANFDCKGVYDIFHTPPFSVRIEYKNSGNNFGFWGIGTPNGYDASGFDQICFWAYTQRTDQAFALNLRDTSDREKGVKLNIENAQSWTPVCVELDEIAAKGVALDRLENVNLNFNKDTLDATVWVDDFEFK